MKNPRIKALRRFAFGLTALNIGGRAVLGFEGSWMQYVGCLLVAYGLELAFDAVENWSLSRQRQWVGPRQVVDHLLPAHITASAVAMLLYPADRFLPLALAVAAGLASKRLLRVNVGAAKRHFLNPSNFGIAFVLVVFPTVGITPPYQFTENLHGWSDAALPVALLGPAMLVTKLTGRAPLIVAWLVGFVAQAVLRSAVTGAPAGAALVPMTGMAFVLFTFYMLPDPGTTPMARRGQALFGLSMAFVYGALLHLHVVYTLFFALVIVCAARGAALAMLPLVARARTTEPVGAPVPSLAAEPAIPLEPVTVAAAVQPTVAAP